MFSSTNNGATWQGHKLRGLSQFPLVTGLALLPGPPSTLYAGTGTGQLLKSTNMGAKWSVVGSLPNMAGVNAGGLSIDKKHPADWYANTSAGFFKSTDSGVTWAPAANGLNNFQVTAFTADPRKSGTLYAATANGVFKTTDGASTWAPINNGIAAAGVTAIAVAPSNSQILYCGSSRLSHRFVAKLDPTGSHFIYSTYLGGNATDMVEGIAADANGNAIVTGSTFSTTFPTASPIQPTNHGFFDAFISKLDPSGALVYSTYFGGSLDDASTCLAVDSSGNGYLAGYSYSPDVQTLQPIQASVGGTQDILMAKFNPDGSLSYSTYFGNGFAAALGIAVDSTGNAYVAGSTYSPDFPTTAGALSAGGNSKLFILRIAGP